MRGKPLRAAAFLRDHLGGDRAATRQEIGKLALYVGAGTMITLEETMAVVGDMAGLELEHALFAATVGDTAMTDRALALALSEGATPVSVLRMGLLHLQRLERLKMAMQTGQSASEAVKAARPPVHFLRQAAMVQACKLWSAESAARACALLWEAEQDCKRSGAPAAVLCRQAVLAVARRAGSRLRAG